MKVLKKVLFLTLAIPLVVIFLLAKIVMEVTDAIGYWLDEKLIS